MVSVSSFDPLAPNATPSSSKHTFKTLERERRNRFPSTNGADHPALEELVRPHVESFNALIDDETNGGKALLQQAVEDIEPRVVFDARNEDGSFGNKITCEPGIVVASAGVLIWLAAQSRSPMSPSQCP